MSMSAPQYHLTQMNIARLVAPLTDPRLADFVAQLDAVNALADTSPSFVWRFQGSEGNATYLRPDRDDRIIYLRTHGPTSNAFTFKQVFDPTWEAAQPWPTEVAASCPD